jgi:sugar phosphate isomerase/epimerase
MKKKDQSQLSRVLMMLITSVIVLSCNSGSKSTDTTVDMDEQTEANVETSPDFQISLAQWSLHKTYFGGAIADWQEFNRKLKESPDDLLQGELDPKDFPEVAAGYGIYSIELVNTFYFSKSGDNTYWTEFKQKCDNLGVNVGLIMCDALGNLGDADPVARKAAVEKHYQWVDVAKILGAHSIRVNAAGQGTPEEVAANAVDGLSKLAEYAASKNINIIVENHGGYSSDGKWLTGVMAKVGMDNVGTLPDFGNFCIERGPDGCVNEYDRYQGIAELMPYAKGVSAKSNEFDENGNETKSDFLRIMKIVKESGFKGYVGIEYEGSQLTEDEGIKATKALLEKVFKEL